MTERSSAGGRTAGGAASGRIVVVQSGASRVFRQSSTVGDAGAVLDAYDWKDQSIESDLKPTAINGVDRWVGLATRRTDGSNYYYVTLRSSGSIQLKRMKDGAFTSYTVTNRRLITRTGEFNKRGHDIPLSRINDVGFDHGLIDRMFGCGTLVIESAGERGQVLLIDVAGVADMHRALGELLYGGDGLPESGR